MCRFDQFKSNQQHFQPTLHSPPEVKIRETMIHEPCSFLKHGHKLHSIRTIRSNQVESTTFLSHPTLSRGAIFLSLVQISYKSTSGRGNDLCRFDQIDLNRQHFQHTLKAQISYIFKVSGKSTSGMSNQQQKGFNMSTS